MSYEQTLIKIIEPIKRTTITRMNRGKKWKYGYNKEHDIVVISKTGKIGEIYEIQGLRIGLPLEPVRGVHVHEKRKWVKIWKQIHDLNLMPLFWVSKGIGEIIDGCPQKDDSGH